MALKIPGVPKPLRLPVQALARAAYLLRGAFVEAAEGPTIATILSQRGDDLQRAERPGHDADDERRRRHLRVRLDEPAHERHEQQRSDVHVRRNG
jgi:hypothetical protein